MARDDGDLYLHLRQDRGGYAPMQVNAPEPMDFEMGNFSGRCLFLHRPEWSFDSPESCDTYPYKEHFHGRKRLWEVRLQGRFKEKPGVLYAGIELEAYVAVTWGTRALMKGLLPLIQKALNCNQVYHEIGNEHDSSLRPVVVAPIWAFDNTLVHKNHAEAPPINAQTIPTGFGRKAAREYWEDLWNGGGPSWNDGGPTYTFAIWGVSPLIDLTSWVFRKLPLTWGRSLSMEPFCGRQPVHAVMYELEDGKDEHRQEYKHYSWDVRIVPEHMWDALSLGLSSPQAAHLAAERAGIDDDLISFCSAMSEGSDPEAMEEMFQDMDDMMSDVDHAGITKIRSVRRLRLPKLKLKKRAQKVAKLLTKIVDVNTLHRLKRHMSRRLVLVFVSITVALIFFWESIPSVSVNVDWGKKRNIPNELGLPGELGSRSR